MINFDQVGLKNNSDKALAFAASAETDDIANTGEVLSAKLNYLVNEDLGISKFFTQTAGRREQFKKLYDLTGDEKWNVSLMSENYTNITYDSELDLTPVKTRRNQDTYEASVDEIKALQKQYPNSDILTPDELAFSIAERARLNREEVSRLVSRSSSNVDLVSNIISMGGYFLDPVVLATLPFTGGASVGRGIVGNAWRSFKIETAVAGAAELAITPQVAEWKKEINSPFTLQDAAFRIIGASVGAGVARSTGSVVLDSTQLFRASRLLKKQGNNADAAIVENYAKVVEGVEPEAHNAHVQAFQASRQAFEEGRFIETAEIERIYAAHDLDLNKAIGRSEFSDILRNRDFKYYSMANNTVDELLYTKTLLARNPIETQRGTYLNNPELYQKSINELGLVWSSEKAAMVKPPKNPQKYFDGKEKLKVATKKDLEKLRLEMLGEENVDKASLSKLEKDLEEQGIIIDVAQRNKELNLSRIEIPKKLRKQGLGTQAMESLVKIADENGLTLTLTPSKEFGATSVGRLTKFYKRFGFVENKGRNKDFTYKESMLRKPIVNSEDEILKQIKTRNVELRLDKTELDDLSKSQIQDVEEMINADDGMFLEVPSFKTNDATGELEISTRPAKEVFEEIDNQDKAMDDIFTCVMGAAA